jgi:hypothetical protein
VFTTGLAIVVALALAGVFGVRSTTVAATEGGLSLRARAPQVTRAGLPASVVITVRRSGGFDEEPVRIAFDGEYLDLFDQQGVRPAPVSETNDGRMLVWEFDPPASDVLRVWLDVVVETGRHFGTEGSVAVLDEAGRTIVRVRFTTTIAP